MLLLQVALVAGCGAVPISYAHDDTLGAEQAAAIVDRALMTQPSKFAAEYVDVTDRFIAYGQGVVTTGRNREAVIPVGGGILVTGGRSRSVAKGTERRIYFDSIRSAELFSKGRWFVVKVQTGDGQPPHHFYLHTQEMGQNLIDALVSLRCSWEARDRTAEAAE